MKKLPLILAATMAFPTTACAASTSAQISSTSSDQVTVSEKDETRISKLKKQFHISNDYKNFFIEKISPSEEDVEIVHRNANPIVENPQEENNFPFSLIKGKVFYTYRWEDNTLGSLRITVNEKGDVFSYSYNPTEKTEDTKLKLDLKKDTIVKEISNFLDLVDPKLKDNYILKNYKVNLYDKTVFAEYERKINKLPFASDRLSVTYNVKTKEVLSFQRNKNSNYALNYITDKNISTPSQPISLEKAKEIFLQKEPLTLTYLPSDKEAKLVYMRESIQPIDGKDGSLVEAQNIFGISPRETMESYKSAKDSALSPTERKEVEQVKGLASQKEAQEMAQAILGKEYNFQTISLYKAQDEYFYDLQFKNKQDKDSFASATLNAKTLEISRFSSDLTPNSKESTLTDQEITQIVQNFVKKYNRDGQNIDLSKQKINRVHGNIYVFIPRVHERIPVYNQGLEFTIDPVKKRISSYHHNFNPLKFQDNKDILSLPEANQKFLNSPYFIAQYIVTKKDVRMVYSSLEKEAAVVDAKSGELLTMGGEKIQDNKIQYGDIDHAKYKDEVLLLADMGIGLSQHNLKDPITNYEGILLLEQLNGNTAIPYEEFPSYIRQYHLEKLKGKEKEKMSRGDFLTGLVNQTYGEQWEKVNGIFRNDLYRDQNTLGEYEKVFIFGKGLSIVDEKEANAKDSISLQDALHWIFNEIHS